MHAVQQLIGNTFLVRWHEDIYIYTHSKSILLSKKLPIWWYIDRIVQVNTTWLEIRAEYFREHSGMTCNWTLINWAQYSTACSDCLWLINYPQWRRFVLNIGGKKRVMIERPKAARGGVWGRDSPPQWGGFRVGAAHHRNFWFFTCKRSIFGASF